MKFFISAIATLIVGSTLAGCDSLRPTGPLVGSAYNPQRNVASSEHGFYPLAIGNSWHYSGIFQMWIVDGNVPGVPLTIHNEIDRELVGSEVRWGRTYIVEEMRQVQDVRPGELFTYWSRFRQDRSGLYLANVCACEPSILEMRVKSFYSHGARSTPIPIHRIIPPGPPDPWKKAWAVHREKLELVRTAISATREAMTAVSTASPADSEETLLSYPLHPGASWTFFGDTWTVEAIEALNVPAGRFTAYRIRIDFPSLGPTDNLVIWESRSGRLGHRVHLTTEATDWQGNQTGTIVSHEVETLESLEISR